MRHWKIFNFCGAVIRRRKTVAFLLSHNTFFTDPTAPLSTAATVAISVVVSSFLSIVIGFLAGLLVMYSLMRKKAVSSTEITETATLPVVGPPPPGGPVYEEVSPKEEIELNTNQAYGPVGL